MKAADYLDVLGQDETWTISDGSVIPLGELTREQRTAVLTWLTDRAEPLMEAEWAPRNIGGNVALGMAHARSLDEVPDAMEWLHDQPLVQRLVSLVVDDEHEGAS